MGLYDFHLKKDLFQTMEKLSKQIPDTLCTISNNMYFVTKKIEGHKSNLIL